MGQANNKISKYLRAGTLSKMKFI